MDRDEALKLLRAGREGVAEWNRRRPGGTVDLRGTDLSKTNLSWVNLSRIDLSGVDFSGADLIDADLIESDLGNARLIEADLSRANLSGADLCGADLSRANLSGAKLSGAELVAVNLKVANLRGAELRTANLSDADLQAAELYGADLSGANLSGANLRAASLFEANLSGASLTGVDLRRANLRGARLIRCSLRGADLTGAQLYGSSRDDWDISEVDCAYVFFDKSAGNRVPGDRNFEPGEFEKLYRSLPTIDYVFENGIHPIDPYVMSLVSTAVSERTPRARLEMQSVDFKGAEPKIVFTFSDEALREQLTAEIAAEYKARITGVKRAFTKAIEAGAPRLDAIDNGDT